MGRIAISACLVGVLTAAIDCRAGETEGPLPKTSEIRAMTAVYRDFEADEKREFEVPRAHWERLFAALTPAERDEDPADWESLGRLEIIKEGGGPFHVSLYAFGKGPGAFAVGKRIRERVYYRGGKTGDLEKALRAAYRASQEEGVAIRKRGRAQPSNPGPELRLPAEPPLGGWSDPDEGARWEEQRRRIGAELSGRPERGPLRCRLRAVPGAAAAGQPELKVEVRNPSDAPVALRGLTTLLDHVTFILRGPRGEVVSSFCYATVRSPFGAETPPGIVFGSGEERADTIYLFVAADHGYRTLQPGRYSIEAVVDNMADEGAGKEGRILARSNRLTILVGQP